MRAEVVRAKSKQPDALIVAINIDRTLRQMRNVGMKAVVLTTSDLMEAIHNRHLPAGEAEGVYFNDWRASDAFRQRFYERYHTEPIMEPQNSYEAVRAVLRAYEINPENPARGMRQVSYDGVTGRIDFTRGSAGNFASGDLYKVKDGTVVRIAP